MNLVLSEKADGKIHIENGGLFDAECGSNLTALELIAINPCDLDEKEMQLLSDRPVCRRCAKLIDKARNNLSIALIG